MHQIGIEYEDITSGARKLDGKGFVIEIKRRLPLFGSMAARNDARSSISRTIVVKIGQDADRITWSLG